jgi:hypothetical protein
LWSFGQGLVQGAVDAEQLWNRLVAALATTPERARRPQVLSGFLQQLRLANPSLASTLLDQAVGHETLAGLYPFLQVAVTLEAPDVARLKHSVRVGRAPAGMYQYLAYGRATDPIPPADLQELVLAIAALQNGYDTALEILHMRLHADKDHPDAIAPELIDAGCALLQQFNFTGRNDREDYRMGDLTKYCLIGEQGAAVTAGLCLRLKQAVTHYETNALYHDDLLVEMLSAQPIAALDALCGGDQQELEKGIRILRDAESRKHPLSVISDQDLTRWCDQDSHARYPSMAQVIMISQRASENAAPRWTSTALRFLERAPDPTVILREFTGQFMPAAAWSGSLAATLESNATLLDQLDAYPVLHEIVIQQKEQVRQWIMDEQRRETAFDRDRDERFE